MSMTNNEKLEELKRHSQETWDYLELMSDATGDVDCDYWDWLLLAHALDAKIERLEHDHQ